MCCAPFRMTDRSPRINGPYSLADLVLLHRPETKSRLPDEELNEAWMAKFRPAPTSSIRDSETPVKKAAAGLVVAWSPSMETPDPASTEKRGLPTSPGLFASPTVAVVELKESDDELPSLSQLGVTLKSTPTIIQDSTPIQDQPTQLPVDMSIDTDEPTKLLFSEPVVQMFTGFTTGSGKR